jgi:4'-phosphopantetheinyl transferase
LTLAHSAAVTLFAVPAIASADDLALLTADELARAQRFVFDRDRAAFATARAALRRILGAELGVAPTAIELEAEAAGRLRFRDASMRDLDFNVTHSGALAAIAITRGRRVGVDIESHTQRAGLDDLIPMIMGPRETELLRHLHGAAFTRAFFDCWTRKEAIVKATGIGISYPVATLDIPTLDGIQDLELPVSESAAWRVVTFSPAADYSMSVALMGAGGDVRIANHSSTAPTVIAASATLKM